MDMYTVTDNSQVEEHRNLFGYKGKGKQPKKGKAGSKQQTVPILVHLNLYVCIVIHQ